MARTAQISKEKRFQELLHVLQVQSQKPLSAMIKLALMRTTTGKEDLELTLLQRITSLELTAPQIAAQINASQSWSNRHISTSTVQRRLHDSGLHVRIAAKKPLLKDTNKKKRVACAKKHKIFGSNCRVFVRRRVGERMISACVIPTVKHGGGRVIVCGYFAGDTQWFI